MLANVISIANQTFRGEAHHAARDAFNARLLTLKRAHDLLTDSNWGQTSVRKIMESALEPLLVEERAVHMEGPEFAFGPRQALALALAANELATNAVKYGALSVPGGKIQISWSGAAGDKALFQWEWRKSGGPGVVTPPRIGFGPRVIKNLLAEELRGTSEIVYAPAGVICRVTASPENLLGEAV